MDYHFSHPVRACLRVAALLTPALFTTSFALGQTTSAETGSAASADQTVVLSPFTVAAKHDYGYQASTSITATGIGTAIADIPANINVITSDFLLDTGIDELRYAVNNVSSVDTDNRALDRYNNLNVRGLPAPIQQSAFDNAFLSMENVARIEIIKGPAAVFNGNVLPGGVINVIKAEPEFNSSGYLDVRYGSFDYFKAALRDTGSIIPNVLAYNVYASFKTKKDADQYTFDHEKFLSGGLKWAPVPKLVSLLDFEVENESYEGIPEEQSGSNPAFIAAVNAGTVPYLQTSRTWLNNNPAYGPNTINVTEYVTNLFYPYPGFNPLGPDAPSVYNGFNIRSDTTLLPTDWLSLSLRSNYNDKKTSSIDFNTFRPVAGAIPGQLLVNSNFIDTTNDTRTFVTKVEAVASFDFWGIKQRILLGFQDEITKSWQLVLSGPLLVWNPRTQGILDGQQSIASAYPNGFPVRPPYQTSIARAYYAADQISALHDELHLLVGVRDSQLSNATGLNQSKATPELGALYRPIKYVSAYVNYSKTFLPNYVLDAFGNELGPTTGKGHDYGLKFDLFDEKLSATMAIYQEDYANIPIRNAPLEAQTHVAPLYILSGLERTAGFESDVVYSPWRNYQLVASFSDSWEHRTITSATVLQDNIPLESIAKYNFNLWNKYTFVTGPLKRLYLGAGAKAVSGGAHLNPSYDVALYGNGYVIFNGLIGYRMKVGNVSVDVQYNAENFTNKVYEGGYAQLGEPRTQYLSVKLAY